MLGTALADIDTAGSGYFVGVNNTSSAYNESKMAYGPQRGNRQLVARVSLLRNVYSVEETVTDEDGNLIYTTGDLGMVRKTYWRGDPDRNPVYGSPLHPRLGRPHHEGRCE